jgi:hypothetical protein
VQEKLLAFEPVLISCQAFKNSTMLSSLFLLQEALKNIAAYITKKISA